jgi:hypothetical protein
MGLFVEKASQRMILLGSLTLSKSRCFDVW